MHYKVVTLTSGETRYTGITWADTSWSSCPHLHRYADLAWTCSRRLKQRKQRDHLNARKGASS